MERLKIGIIGCGVIGTELAKAIDSRFSQKAEVVALCDLDKERASKLADSLKESPRILSIEELIAISDLVIEAASKDISANVAHQAISNDKDVMVMSVGGLIGRRDLFDLANEKKVRLYLPSGALCGLDGVKSASIGKIRSCTLTTRKPPEGFRGAPYVVKNEIDLDAIKQETVLFEGTAQEAVEGFPQNINVAASLSLAGIGPELTRVRIITSPEFKRNSHEVTIEGEFGKLTARTDNLPSPKNPKTSFLACLSAIATLKGIIENVKIGT